MRNLFVHFSILAFTTFSISRITHAQPAVPPFLGYLNSSWVDSVMHTLSPDERIAQLIMVAAYSNQGDDHRQQLLKMIREQKIGGLVFFQGGAGRQAALINQYQSASEVPLLIAMDAEWGPGMRLDSAISYPFQMTLGAIQNNELIYQMGKLLGVQLKRVGAHVNFAPVVDVNSNPDNPVINYRSFGENKRKVAEKGIAFMKGMQDVNVLTTAKHFPGHGDTDTDSHYALPQINHPNRRLDSNAPGVVDKDALLAGSDVLELTEDVPGAIEEIRRAVQNGLITQREIDDRCRRMLAVKHWVGLHDHKPLNVSDAVSEVRSPEAKLLNRKLMEAALTVLKNKRDLIPLRELDTLSIASVSFGGTKITPFQKTLSLYTKVTHFNLPGEAGQPDIETLRSQLSDFNLVIGGIHDQGTRPLNKSGLSAEVHSFISELAGRENVIMAVFKNPYVLEKLKDIEMADVLILTYEDNANAEDLAAQLIFGGVGASGRMPVTAGTEFCEGDGVDVIGGMRLGYTFPEEVGMDSEMLFKGVDSLVYQALEAKAIPGCQVLIARNRKVIMHKAYGLHTYSDTVTVKPTDLYDLASVTKVSTSMAALMKLYDEGKFRLEATLGDFIPKFKRSNKRDVQMKDILTHQGGLIPFIPFYQKTFRKNGSYKWATVKKDSSKRFPIKLTEEMFLHRKYPDKIVKGIRKSPLRPERKYVYSDFFFMLAPRVVESMIDQDFASYLHENFYSSLGAKTVTYNPFSKYSGNEIVPTENDYMFRHRTVHGTVHDENAAMMKGISGHAGLFANANDLAKLMQMYLDMGTYGGKRYIREETLREFSRTQFPENDNHRALGFDKPTLDYRGVGSNTAKGAGPNSFGHTGFTGTFVWMDPDSGLLYIFLSNRVTPTRENTRLSRLNTRTQIQQVMYDALAAGRD